MPIGAAIGAATIGGAASIGSAVIQGNAANKAAKTVANAQQDTLDYTKGVYNDTKANVAPTIGQGQDAGTALAGLLNLPGSDPAASQDAFDRYRKSTNYDFILNQGENAVKTANAPAFASGATAKALNDYAQGKAGDALSGYEGLLQGEQQIGAQSALGLGGVGASTAGVVNSGNQVGSTIQAGAGMSAANSNVSALANLTKALNQGITASSFGKPGGGGGGGFLNDAPQSLQSDLAGLF